MSHGTDYDLARSRVIARWKLRCRTAKQRKGAGNFKPGVVLLVGERTAHPMENRYHAPFCAVTASSGWLNTQLAHSTISEDKLFWINALDNDGTPIDLAQLVLELAPKYIIALGNVARERLSFYKLKHDHVPHPQYWKRFKSKQTYPLINILESYDYTNS
jgi:hypothetical protein